MHGLDNYQCLNCKSVGLLKLESPSPQGGDLWRCGKCKRLTWHKWIGADEKKCGHIGYNFESELQKHVLTF